MDSENENGKEDVSLESNQPKNLIDPSEFQHSPHNISESPLKKKVHILNEGINLAFHKSNEPEHTQNFLGSDRCKFFCDSNFPSTTGHPIIFLTFNLSCGTFKYGLVSFSVVTILPSTGLNKMTSIGVTNASTCQTQLHITN